MRQQNPLFNRRAGTHHNRGKTIRVTHRQGKAKSLVSDNYQVNLLLIAATDSKGRERCGIVYAAHAAFTNNTDNSVK